MSKGFSINDILGNAKANAPAGQRMQVVMLPAADIEPNPENSIYEIGDVSMLKADIAERGLRSPLEVLPAKGGRYMLIAGHRRWTACRALTAEGVAGFEVLPCVIRQSQGEDDDLIALITSNATARELTDGERLRQYRALKQALERKKAAGALDGRIRDEMSRITGDGTGTLGRLNAIVNNCVPEVLAMVERGEITMTRAYECSKLYKVQQVEYAKIKYATMPPITDMARRAAIKYLVECGLADQFKKLDYVRKSEWNYADNAYALVTKYGEGSAALAAQMYDELAALQNVRVPPAEPAPTAQYGEVAKMVQATRESPPQMQRGVSRLVKRAGADTTLKNAQRDGAEFAWVPHGDSCAFCLTLASRGWQRASQAAIRGGHAEHIHANCDCEYAVRFDGRTSVAGYDPEAYLAQYNAAGGDINRMRRVNYAANKERINAQKRAAYAARVENQKKDAIIKADTVGLDNDRYTIAEPKISQYLLKPEAKHAAEFFDAGYSETDTERLNRDIYQQFDESLKVDIRILDDGTEAFSIFMELGTTGKKSFRTVWQRESGSEKPRFITAHREEKKR